jgi:hypothetical protein
MRYSSIQLTQLGTNNTSGGFYSVNLNVGVLKQEEREALFRDGYVTRSFHMKYSDNKVYNIFFTEAHPYFNVGVIGAVSDDLYKDYISSDLFQELLELFNYKHLQKV